MKHNIMPFFLIFSAALVIGIVSGAAVQKFVGFGNVFRSVGVPYPTQVPPPDPYAASIIEVQPEHQGSLMLFLLVGQSNMVGWAPLPDSLTSDPRVYLFGNDYRWKIAAEPVDSAQYQVDLISADRVAAYGPSLAFALASLERHPEVAIGLVPCAKSSSSIRQWQRNLSDQSLYGSCLKRARAASPMGRLAGVLFFQGEADAMDPVLYAQFEPSADEWPSLFSAFVTGMRADLQDPQLPVVYAQIGANPMVADFPNWETVQRGQEALQLPRTAMIHSDDLALFDGLHFTAESYRVIGERFAEAYWDLVSE